MINRIRTQFQAGENVVEEGLIDTGHLATEPIKVNGVAGMKITSPILTTRDPLL